MAYRIPLTDPRLIAREEQAIADLQELYPDGRVTVLDSRDRALGKRLSSLYVAIGYESRVDMLEAWGFEVVLSKGGRKATIDPEAIIAELGRRYEGKEKPQQLGILVHDNPDLAGNIKSLSNMSNELFGQTLARELADRGILARARSSADVTDDELRAMVEDLEARYRDADSKLSTVAALKAAHPEYKVEFAALASRSELVFGKGQRELLLERGIMRANRTRRAGRAIGCTDEEVWEAIDQLGALLSELPNDEKPKTIPELAKSYPEQGPYINEGKARGLTDKGPLQELGILQRTTALLKRSGVRRTPPEQMGQLYVQAGGAELVRPDDSSAALLPRGVCGVDIERGLELRELLVGVRAGDAVATLAVGDVLRPVLEERSEEWNPEKKYHVLLLEDAEGRRCPAYAHDRRVYDDAVDQSDSPLAAYAGGEVLSVQADKTAPVVLVRLRVLSALRTSTLAQVLRGAGYIDERDVRGSMAWRYRIWHADYTGEKLESMPSESSGDGETPAFRNAATINLTAAPLGNLQVAPVPEELSKGVDEPGAPSSPALESAADETIVISDGPTVAEDASAQIVSSPSEGEPVDSIRASRGVADVVDSPDGDEVPDARTFVDSAFSFGYAEKPGQRYATMAALDRQLTRVIEQKRREGDASKKSQTSVAGSSESARIARENAARDERLEQLKAKWAEEAARREGGPVERPTKAGAASPSSTPTSSITAESDSECIRRDNAERDDRMAQLRAKWAAEAARREGRPYNAEDLKVDPPKQRKDASSKGSGTQATASKRETAKPKPQRNASSSVEKRSKTTATPATKSSGAGALFIACIVMWVVFFGLAWVFSFGNAGTAAAVATIATVAGIAGLNSNKK